MTSTSILERDFIIVYTNNEGLMILTYTICFLLIIVQFTALRRIQAIEDRLDKQVIYTYNIESDSDIDPPTDPTVH